MSNKKEVEINHDTLVQAGSKWLASCAPVVVTELSGGQEEADVIAFGCNLRKRMGKKYFKELFIPPMYGYGTIIIECKASITDFKVDAKKDFRIDPGKGMGDYRFYLTPPGLVSIEDLLPGWGLIEMHGKKIKIMHCSQVFKETSRGAEVGVLTSVIRRIAPEKGNHMSMKVKHYTLETKNTATLITNKDAELYPDPPPKYENKGLSGFLEDIQSPALKEG